MKNILTPIALVFLLVSCDKKENTVSDTDFVITSYVDNLSITAVDHTGTASVQQSLQSGKTIKLPKEKWRKIFVECPKNGCEYVYNGKRFWYSNEFQ